MSEERLTALEQRIADIAAAGASVTVQDPRVSQVQNWILAAVGGGIVLALAWGANSINRLNETMARVVTQNEAIMSTQADHAERLKELERRR